MQDRTRGLVAKVALLGGGVAAGAVIASAVTANAATTGSGSTATNTAYSSAPSGSPSGSTNGPANGQRPANGQPPANVHGAKPVRDDEKSVDSATAAKLKAAAVKAVPGGTVYRIETDSGDATYEAHMTKSDGTDVTVKFDKSLAVTAVEAGMGK